MKFQVLTGIALATVIAANDHQTGLKSLVRDYGTAEFRNAVLGHAALGDLFNLPTIITTSADTGKKIPLGVLSNNVLTKPGPNGQLPKEIVALHPNVTIIRRQGEVDAWDNADFRAAVKATGKKHIILAGVVTEVCK
ncbi:hypothetical protein ACLOAV_008760 [Pseudogymnoascus australis]